MKICKVGLIVLLFSSLLACATAKGTGPSEWIIGPSATLVGESVVLPLDKKGETTFMGSGCEPGQEIRLLFKTVDGVVTDIGAYLKPKSVVANDSGAWLAVWKYGRFVSRKLIKKGVYEISVADTKYNILASTPIMFQ